MTDEQLAKEEKRLLELFHKASDDRMKIISEVNGRRVKSEISDNYKSAEPFIKIAQDCGWTADHYRLDKSGYPRMEHYLNNNVIKLYCDKNTLANFLLNDLNSLKSTHKVVFNVPCDPTTSTTISILPLDYKLT